MNNPRRSEWLGPSLAGSGPIEPQVHQYPPLTDPAYAEQAPYAPAYGASLPPWTPKKPPQQLPRYWQQDQPPPTDIPPEGLTLPPPHEPKSPHWFLWVVAGASVVLVVGLVMALIIANGAIKTQTAVPPLPAITESSSATPTPTTKTSPTPTAGPAPSTTGSGTLTQTIGPSAMLDVVYSITGQGRAISVTYMDTGDVIQTEFNVVLPWSKQVSLSKSAVHPASVTIVNIGHDVTCSVTVAGVQIRQHTGVGLTICDAPR
ncbi:putative membrane protein [Mycobacterium leprae]|uniref:Membrane protein n=4 Tax=Mycobacterium leprae TaxID=1769 RepID=Q9CCU3_MYCLE|nr:MmpS family transport accessory protein [Mycobacterium leprae]CAR70524.1 putative membrane protein [Mycobacterium leprae Br4923]AWV47349.1 hypothetical protein DIJ64_02320 [Mycobacterium leprae]OAR20300.1 hypothetical protein A8144_11525 [Mycobacterium leprae 3125609]OAX70606.1 hypothetical protein A3216_10990 [Mycobacterium leprae 7935681]CAC29939.1 putative membrane protein [Mycobacterium leprae]